MMPSQKVPDQKMVPLRHSQRIERRPPDWLGVSKQLNQFPPVESRRFDQIAFPQLRPQQAICGHNWRPRVSTLNESAESVLRDMHRDVVDEDRENQCGGI